MIKNHVERKKAQFLYDTYFNPDAEHRLDFNLFDTLAFYGLMSDKKADKLDKKFDDIGSDLFKKMLDFDKKLIKELK